MNSLVTTLVNKVLIVGGGIGGMCAAIQLRKQGIEVDLVEINPLWSVYGAGITISGPTLRALRSVGVVDEVIARGGQWTHIDFCSPDGALMRTLPMAPAEGAEGLPPAGGILRPVLADILGRATLASGAVVRLGVTFESITQDAAGGRGVGVAFSDGSSARYELVIGADGVNSKTRAALWPEAPAPRFTGQGSWRTVVPRMRRNSTMYLGHTTKAGLNPVAEDQSYLFTLDQREHADFIEPTRWPGLLADLLAEFAATQALGDVRARLLDGRITHEQIVYRPLLGHLMPAPWHRGRVVLLGDAVHATTPHLASGAGIAIEGALVLAEELARRHSLEGALAAYAGRCYDRARLVVMSSLRMGELEQHGGSKDEQMQTMAHAMEALRAAI